VRADLNVPVKNGRVTDSTRIDRTAITLKELLGRGARVVLLAHFGRPDGKRVPDMSLRPVLDPLSKALGGMPVAFAEDCIGEPARKAVAALKDGEIALLENLRFHAAEEKNDPAFARELASLGDLYVNDAFSCAHRAHASTEAIARLLPSAAGRLMEAELNHLSKALGNPARPLAAIVGGAKISTKLDLLGNLVKKVDVLVIGGAMANTFLAAQGVEIGASLAERDMADTAREILQKARAERCEILLPSDVVVAADLKPNLPTQTVAVGVVGKADRIFDIGPQTVLEWLLSGGSFNINGSGSALSSPMAVPGSTGTIVQFLGFVGVTTGQTFTVTHDDGLTLIIGATNLGFDPGPSGPTTSTAIYNGPSGTFPFQLVYGECCGSPAVLQVNLPLQPQPVPEPATLTLACTGIVLAGLRRRFQRRR